MFLNYILLALVLGAISVFAWFELTQRAKVDSNLGLSLLKQRLNTEGETSSSVPPGQGSGSPSNRT